MGVVSGRIKDRGEEDESWVRSDRFEQMADGALGAVSKDRSSHGG